MKRAPDALAVLHCERHRQAAGKMVEGSHHQSDPKVRVVAQVPVIDGLLTPYHEFRDKFMRPNLPVLITGLMQHWRASMQWATHSGDPNLDYLSTHFGNSRVQVAECSTRDFTDQKRLDMTVAEFIAYWKGHNANLQKTDSSASLLYLKDWHFVKDYPEYSPYTTPTLFMDDWLNFYLEHHQLHLSEGGVERDACFSDYRFVYMGPKGTWTPLHADVFRSYSWSGNVCGRKLWHLLPSSETHLIYDRHMRSTVYNIYGDVSVKEFPNFHQAGWLECTQERGQILFVPSGWYHQVTNLEDAVSINHNWFNGYNLHWVWKLLLADYKETRASIEDIRSVADNFEELCQRNLAANSGMNLYDFFVFLSRMTGFFFSFLRHNNSMQDKEDGKIQKGKSWVQSLCTESVCRNVLSEVLFNLKSIGCVAELLASAGVSEGCLSASVAVRQKTENQVFEVGKEEDDRLGCWDGYLSFLTEMSSQCVVHTKHSTAGVCLCAYPVGTPDLETSSESVNIQNRCTLLLHDNSKQKCLKDFTKNDCEAINKSFAGNATKDDADELKVTSPKQLAQVIRSAVHHLNKKLHCKYLLNNA